MFFYIVLPSPFHTVEPTRLQFQKHLLHVRSIKISEGKTKNLFWRPFLLSCFGPKLLTTAVSNCESFRYALRNFFIYPMTTTLNSYWTDVKKYKNGRLNRILNHNLCTSYIKKKKIDILKTIINFFANSYNVYWRANGSRIFLENIYNTRILLKRFFWLFYSIITNYKQLFIRFYPKVVHNEYLEVLVAK